MNKTKSLIFIATLVVCLVGLSVISAGDVSNDTVQTLKKQTPQTATDSVNTAMKNIKKEETTDLYVSDTDGSDDNSGTSDSPYKTIQKAVDQTSTDSTYNIHIADGTYKGLGNTNITIDGNKFINFLGADNTIIDGEVNYTTHTSSEGDYYWGSSKVWEPYDDGTGNWAFTITNGTGLITINDLTIQNCWNPGGSSINLYETATIDNYGNLEIDNVSFIFNHGGVGASIRNNKYATITVTNSLFDGNRKSSSTGNYGAGIYNNGTATIINSTFQNNYARWGTITNDKIMSVINCTIRDNIAYDGGSTYKTGSGITASTDGTNYYEENDEKYPNSLLVDGCTFINNQQADVYGINLIINNSLFNRSVGVYLINNTTVTNSQFYSCTPTTLHHSLSNNNAPVQPIVISENCVVSNNTILNITNTNSETAGLIINNGNNVVFNNTLDRKIKLSGASNNITYNTVNTTKDTHAVDIGVGSTTVRKNIIANNVLVATLTVGDQSVNISNVRDNIIENNTPLVTTITLNDSSYDAYFKNGKLLNNSKSVERINIVGTLNNKDIILDVDHPIIISQTRNNVNQNLSVTAKSGTSLTINNLRVNNTNNKTVLTLESDENSIIKSILQTNAEYAIILTGENNVVNNNTLFSELLVGNDAVSTTGSDEITNNIPTYVNYILNDESYANYFDDTGYLLETLPSEVYFVVDGKLTNKDLTFDKNIVHITGRNNEATMEDTSITTKDDNTLYFSKITMNNTNKIAFDISSHNTNISNNIIYSNTTVAYIHDIDNIPSQYMRFTSNNITINTTNSTAIIVENSTTSSTSYGMKPLNVTRNMINMTGDNITAISANETLGLGLAGNILNMEGNILTGIMITNDELHELNGTTVNTYTATVMGSSKMNLNSQQTAIGVYAENMNIVIYDSDKININSADSAIGVCMINCTNSTKPTVNITCKNNATAILCTGSPYMSYQGIVVDLDADYTYAIILVNSTQQNILSYFSINNTFTLNGKNNTAIIISNSSDVLFNNTRIYPIAGSDQTALIYVDNSENVDINGNIVKGTYEYSVYITDCTNTQVTDNDFLGSQRYGDASVYDQNDNSIIKNNRPITTTEYTIQESNYYDYFNTDGTLKETIPEGVTIQQIGDIYNKNMIINKNIKFTSSSNIYLTDSTITIDCEDVTLDSINVKNTDKEAIIVNGNNNNINDLHMDITQTIDTLNIIVINGNNNTLKYKYINTQAATPDNNLFTNIITINGESNIITTQDEYYPATYTLQNHISSKNIQHTKAILMNNTHNNIIECHLNITGTTQSNGIYMNNSEHNQLRCDIKVDNDTGLYLENSSNNNILVNTTSEVKLNNSNNNILQVGLSGGYGQLNINNQSNNNTIYNSNLLAWYDLPLTITNSEDNNVFLNNITIRSTDGIVVNISEGRGNYIHHNLIYSNSHSGNDAVLQEVINEYEVQNKVENNYNQTGRGYANQPFNPWKTWTVTSEIIGLPGESIPVTVALYSRDQMSTMTPYNITSGTLTVMTDDKNETFNVTGENITFDYTITDSPNQVITVYYLGDTNQYEPSINTTNVKVLRILTDDNYNEFFTDGILKADVKNLVLGSDIYNKDLTFNKPAEMINPENYTIYNTTMILKEKTNITGVNIVNTDGRETTLVLELGSRFVNGSIITEGDNQKTIIMSGDNSNIATLMYNNIEITGVNSTAIKTTTTLNHVQGIATNCNNITLIGNNTKLIDANGQINFQVNKLLHISNDTTTINGVNYTQTSGQLSNNNITVIGNNINLINALNCSLRIFNNNNFNLTGSNITAINFNSTSQQLSVSRNNITVTTDTSISPINLYNTTVTLNANQIVTTTEGVPIINITPTTTRIAVTNNYLESKDLCGNDAVSGATTNNGNTPSNEAGYKSVINIDADELSQYKTTTIPITVTDAYGEPIEGTLTVTVNGDEVTVENNIIEVTPQTTDNVVIVATYNDPTGKYNTTTITKTLTVKEATTIITVEPVAVNIGDVATITATVVDQDGDTVSVGRVAFKVNGKVLRDSVTNKVVYADVTDGTATINYEDTTKWDNDTTIQAIYMGSTTQPKSESEVVNPTVTVPETEEPEFSVEDVTTSAGSEVTITVTTKNLDAGKIVLKVNGKTVKASDGKLYTKNTGNSVTFTYTVPKTLKAGEYDIKAVYTSGTTKLETESKLTVE